jgi:EAL domain-containing protein (putative c-di-GMP-specific phosphodiesterase class I)
MSRFTLQYQPIVAPGLRDSVNVVAVEQLSGGGSYGYAYDQMALRFGCIRMAEWQHVYPGLSLSVNVAPEYFGVPGYARSVIATLVATGLAPERLTLETLETSPLMLDETTIDNLLELQYTGVHLAFDDLGSGYFADPAVVADLLERLGRYGIRIPRLKLDVSLAGSLHHRARPFLDLGAGRHIVAEGVETPLALKAALELGLLVQGWAISPKLMPDALERFLSRSLVRPLVSMSA